MTLSSKHLIDPELLASLGEFPLFNFSAEILSCMSIYPGAYYGFQLDASSRLVQSAFAESAAALGRALCGADFAISD